MARRGKPGRAGQPGAVCPLIGAVGERPRVVLAVGDDLRAVRRTIRRAHVDIVELRIDLFRRHDLVHVQRVVRAMAAFGRPLLATIRSAAEGGGTEIDDLTRARLWEQLLPHVAAIDVEIRCARALRGILEQARAARRLVVLSSHDFERTPELRRLAAGFRRARQLGADVVKFATYAGSPEELWRLAAFTWSNRAAPIVTMAMGPLGPLSRLFLPAFGSRWVYTSVTPAHGQIPLERLMADLVFYYR